MQSRASDHSAGIRASRAVNTCRNYLHLRRNLIGPAYQDLLNRYRSEVQPGVLSDFRIRRGGTRSHTLIPPCREDRAPVALIQPGAWFGPGRMALPQRLDYLRFTIRMFAMLGLKNRFFRATPRALTASVRTWALCSPAGGRRTRNRLFFRAPTGA